MPVCLTLIDWLKPQASDPLGRWGAARSHIESGGSSGTVWILVALGLLCLVGVGILVAALSGARQQARRTRQFHARAKELGLSDKENRMLRALVRHAGLRQPMSVFTSADAFDRGGGLLLATDAMTQAPAPQREAAEAVLNRLREKLGFRRALAEPKPGEAIVGDVPANTLVHVFRPRLRDYLDARVADTVEDGAQLEVVTEELIPHEFGEEWEIRFSDGRLLWEMNASVTRHDGLRVFLKLAGTARSVNRRRFVRTPTNRPAYMTPFNFERRDADPDPPVFQPAALVEIAGPGLKLESLMDAGVGDKVLVGIQFGGGRVLQGQAAVRRAEVSDSGLVALAVEMLGLTTSEVAELARETNLAMTTRQMEFAPAEAQAEG